MFPTVNTEYSSAAHFLVDEEGKDWSVVLRVLFNPSYYESICEFRFLFPENAPTKLLINGSKFKLYESRKVADCEIVITT
ncbi:hypothetical protein D3C73_1423180 [compost metagenome]